MKIIYMNCSVPIEKQISIIVPVYNEEKILSANYSYWYQLSQVTELIFVDGGSTDRSVELAAKLGKLLHSKKGRALQMNLGACKASGKILLFIHADTRLDPAVIPIIMEKLEEDQLVGGCFSLFLAGQNILYRLIDYLGTMRAKLTRIFYGDQGLFIKKNIFFNLGGFPAVPIMEDVLFSAKMKKKGRTIVLPEKIWISPRRWEQRGIVATILTYLFLSSLFYLGFPLAKIRKIYEDLR